MKEYWLESNSGQSYFQETKDEFFKSINAGFRGFIKYETGNEVWIKNNNKKQNYEKPTCKN